MKTLPRETRPAASRQTLGKLLRTDIVCALAAACFLAAGCARGPATKRPAEPLPAPDTVAFLRQSNESVIEQIPEAAAHKFKKMSGGLFVFYRGTSDLFYAYSRSYGIDDRYVPREGAQVQLHGDYHLENCGAFKSEQGNITFDLLDFDDAFTGPYLVDLRRLAVSLLIACDEKGWNGRADEMVNVFLESYAAALTEIAGGSMTPDFCYRSGSDAVPVQSIIDKVSRVDRHQYLEKGCRTHIASNGRRVFSGGKGYARVGDAGFLKTAMGQYMDTVLSEYRRDDDFYALKDAVINTKSGIGSAGKLKYLVLIEGETTDQFDDVVLEFKEETQPFWLEQYGCKEEHSGRRVFMGYYRMQSEAYPCIGYTGMGDRQFFVSEMTPYYREFELDDVKNADELKEMAAVSGKLIAKAHVRSAQDPRGAAAAIAGAARSGEFRASIRAFSRDCYRFMKKGYEEFRERLKTYPLLCVLVRV